MRRDVFQAIAEPTRREILGMLTEDKRMNINAVADQFTVSRTAIYKHIKILTECGLIHVRQEGREKFCEVRLEPLAEVDAWISRYSRFWTKKLDALEAFVETQTNPAEFKKKKNKKQKKS